MPVDPTRGLGRYPSRIATIALAHAVAGRLLWRATDADGPWWTLDLIGGLTLVLAGLGYLRWLWWCAPPDPAAAGTPPHR